MSGPPPTWNDPDWPSTLGGWVILSFVFAAFVTTFVLIVFLIGGSL